MKLVKSNFQFLALEGAKIGVPLSYSVELSMKKSFTTWRPGQNNILQPSYHSDENEVKHRLVWSTKNLLIVDSFYLVITECLYSYFLTSTSSLFSRPVIDIVLPVIYTILTWHAAV